MRDIQAIVGKLQVTEGGEVIAILTVRQLWLIDTALNLACEAAAESGRRDANHCLYDLAMEYMYARGPILEAFERLKTKAIVGNV